MKKYEVEYWEKVSVWVRQRVLIKSDKKPTKRNLKDIIEKTGCDFEDSDYNWETMENEDYDFDTDFKAEEIK